MAVLLAEIHLSSSQWLIVFLCSFLVGMSKTGVPGVGMLVVPAMAIIFGGKASTGVLLPMLIFADFFAVIYYHRHAEWKPLLKALPWAVLGLIFALWLGSSVNDHQFRQIIAVSVLFSLGLMIWRDLGKKHGNYSHHPVFAATLGIIGGFATMIGNVAGPVFAIYLLALKLPKNNFIGTTAWFFAIINLTKLPLQYFVWQNIHPATFTLNLISLPFILAGAFAGIKIVKYIKEDIYRWIVVAITFVSALIIFL